MWPWLTAKPANGMVASLGIGMQALSRSMRTKTAGSPHWPMRCRAEGDDGIDDVLHDVAVPYHTAAARGDRPLAAVLVVGARCASVLARPRAPVCGAGSDASYQEALDVPIGLMDIKGQIADVQDEVEAAVLAVVRSGQFILGPNVKALEAEITTICRPPAQSAWPTAPTA